MAAPTKNQKIEALVKLVQKRSRGAGLTTSTQRTVLETLMYAALLENASSDKAELAFTVLENHYIDWNEIRVCSVGELADTLMDLPHPEAAAERIRKALQGIFEKTYMFDLEELRKKGKALAEHIKTLETMSAGTPYMIQYAAQVALDGHLIPLDEASLRIMRRLGLSQVSHDGAQEICIGLDRVILKKSGLTFAAQLHHFAAGYYDIPDSPDLLSQLSAIDSEAVNRNWISPILTASSSMKPIASAPASVREPISETQSIPKTETPVVKPKVPPKVPSTAKPAKVASKPVAKKSLAKPMKKPVSMKPVTKQPKKSVKPMKKPAKPVVKKAKKTPPKIVKAPLGKGKNVLPKKSVKPIPPKKKVVVKKAEPKKVLVKPAKKSKTASPSKSLRKRKPK